MRTEAQRRCELELPFCCREFEMDRPGRKETSIAERCFGNHASRENLVGRALRQFAVTVAC